MSIEGWIASVTGVLVAIGTWIGLVYTPFGRAVRRTFRTSVAFVLRRGRQMGDRLSTSLDAHRAGVEATLLLLAVWLLASPTLFVGPVAWPPFWIWTTRAVAAAASGLACLLAFKQQVVDLQIAPQAHAVEPNAQELANRRFDLLRQAYALAAAMLKYVPADPKGQVNWDDVQQFNQLIYQLLAVKADVQAFEIRFAWTREVFGSGRQVEAYLVGRQLEGMITYTRSNGIGLPSTVIDEAGSPAGPRF